VLIGDRRAGGARMIADDCPSNRRLKAEAYSNDGARAISNAGIRRGARAGRLP